ncbi:MAG TPA: DUF4430 domain-containing protein [bacterium]|nr:DUF4430 domain-containing protein [bacterium]
MRKIHIFIGVGIGIMIIVIGWAIFSNEVGRSIPKEEIEILQENIKKEIVLVIDDGEGDSRTFKVGFNKGMTAFDALKNKAKELGLTLKTKTFDIGIMIEAIGNKENGKEGKYWLYYVNGETPMVAADKKELKPGDKIEFKFEKSPF